MAARGWTETATVDWKRVVAPHAFRVPIRDLRLLLRDEDKLDANTQKRFEAWARGDVRDVRFEVDTRIASELRHGAVPDYNDLDLYDIQKEAESLEKDYPGRAESVYMGLTESLGMHYEIIDDSMGTFWPMFEECLEAMGRCIGRQEITAEDRRWRIEYHAGWSLAVFVDFMEYYEKLLGGICTDIDDLNVWKKILEGEMQDGQIGYDDVWDTYHRPRVEKTLAIVQSRLEKAGGAPPSS